MSQHAQPAAGDNTEGECMTSQQAQQEQEESSNHGLSPQNEELEKTRKDLAAAQKALRFFMNDHQRLRKLLKQTKKMVQLLEERKDKVVDHMVEQGDLIDFFVHQEQQTEDQRQALQSRDEELAHLKMDLETTRNDRDTVMEECETLQKNKALLESELLQARLEIEHLTASIGIEEKESVEPTDHDNDPHGSAKSDSSVEEVSEENEEAHLVDEVRYLEAALWEAETERDRMKRELQAFVEVSELERKRLASDHRLEIKALQNALSETRAEVIQLSNERDAATLQQEMETESARQRLCNVQLALDAQKESSRMMQMVYERMLREQGASLGEAIVKIEQLTTRQTTDTAEHAANENLTKCQEFTTKYQSLEASLEKVRSEIESVVNGAALNHTLKAETAAPRNDDHCLFQAESPGKRQQQQQQVPLEDTIQEQTPLEQAQVDPKRQDDTDPAKGGNKNARGSEEAKVIIESSGEGRTAEPPPNQGLKKFWLFADQRHL